MKVLTNCELAYRETTCIIYNIKNSQPNFACSWNYNFHSQLPGIPVIFSIMDVTSMANSCFAMLAYITNIIGDINRINQWNCLRTRICPREVATKKIQQQRKSIREMLPPLHMTNLVVIYSGTQEFAISFD